MILECFSFISTCFLISRNHNDYEILVVVLNKRFSNNINPLLSKGLKEDIIIKTELF